MSTVNLTLTGALVRIADGPQSVTVNFKEGIGEYFAQDALVPGATPPAPAPETFGAYLGQQPQSMYLEADQSLYVKGAGLLVILSKTQAF